MPDIVYAFFDQRAGRTGIRRSEACALRLAFLLAERERGAFRDPLAHGGCHGWAVRHVDADRAIGPVRVRHEFNLQPSDYMMPCPASMKKMGTLDGLVYALLIGGTCGWLWPR